MTDSIIYQGATYRAAMAVILPDVVKHDWGWFSEDHERMHLQTVDLGYLHKPRSIHVWLEDRGTRTFRIDSKDEGKLNSKAVRKLRAAVENDRNYIEELWTSWAIRKGWVSYDLVGDVLTITVYKKHNRFWRQFSLCSVTGLSEKYAAEITEDDLALDPKHAALIVGRHVSPDTQIHVMLPHRLWLDA